MPLVDIAYPPVECRTNAEAEEATSVIMHSLAQKLFDDYGLDFACDDYKSVFRMIKNYVIHENLKANDILEIQYEEYSKIVF